MKLKQAVLDALDGAYLKLARIGPEDRKKGHGVALLMGWLFFLFVSVWGFVDHWIYPIQDWYESVWPYRSKNFYSPFSTMGGMAIPSMILGLWIAYRTSKRCSHLIDYSETTTKEWVFFFVWLFSVGFGTILLSGKYSIIGVLAHLAAFHLASSRAK